MLSGESGGGEQQLESLEARVDRLSETIARLAHLLNKPSPYAKLLTAWADEVAYADSIRQFYLWQLYRDPGESDEHMHSRFFHTIEPPTWDPIVDVRRAAEAILAFIDRVCEVAQEPCWLIGNTLADAIQFGGFSPDRASLDVGISANALDGIIRALPVKRLIIRPAKGDAARPTYLLRGIKAARWAVVRLHIYSNVAEYLVESVKQQNSLDSLSRLECYHGCYSVPENAVDVVRAMGIDLTRLPDYNENRTYSKAFEYEVRALQELAQAVDPLH
jgi:hypothetical protein